MVNKNFIPNHLHLICRGKCLKPPTQEIQLDKWLTELVEIVNMKILVKPKCVYEHDPNNQGITGTVVLSTSHASIHFWDISNPALLQFDIYSCDIFNFDDIIKHLQQFELTELQWIKLDRNNDISILDQGILENIDKNKVIYK